MKKTVSQVHAPAVMVRQKPFMANTHYVGKGWTAKFACPECGLITWQHLNFLGSRTLVCNGSKIQKLAAVPEFAMYTDAGNLAVAEALADLQGSGNFDEALERLAALSDKKGTREAYDTAVRDEAYRFVCIEASQFKGVK